MDFYLFFVHDIQQPILNSEDTNYVFSWLFFCFIYNIFSKSCKLAIFGNSHIGSCLPILIVHFENSHNLIKTDSNSFGSFRIQNWLLVGLVVGISWARYYSPVPLLGFWNYGCWSYVIDCSTITGADNNKISENYGCQIAYFSNLRVHEPVKPWLTRAL